MENLISKKLPDKISERLPRDFVSGIVRLGQIQSQKLQRNLEVGLVEVVWDVEPDAAILAAILHNSSSP